jgi:hypothetical protein
MLRLVKMAKKPKTLIIPKEAAGYATLSRVGAGTIEGGST